MMESVRHDLWKKVEAGPDADDAAEPGQPPPPGADEGLWERKYHDLLKLLQKKDREIWDIKEKILDSIKDSSMQPLDRGGGSS